MTTTKNTLAAKVAFSWTEKNYAEILAAYVASGRDNSNKALLALAELVGAKSAQAVRSKLSTSGDYVKVEGVKVDSDKPAKVTKIQLTRNIESVLTLEKDSLESLSKGNVAEIELITGSILGLLKRIAELENPEVVPVPADESTAAE